MAINGQAMPMHTHAHTPIYLETYAFYYASYYGLSASVLLFYTLLCDAMAGTMQNQIIFASW